MIEVVEFTIALLFAAVLVKIGYDTLHFATLIRRYLRSEV